MTRRLSVLATLAITCPVARVAALALAVQHLACPIATCVRKLLHP